MDTTTCKRCNARIYLAHIGVDAYKWVTNPDKPNDTWKCRPTGEYPVRSHAPEQDTNQCSE